MMKAKQNLELIPKGLRETKHTIMENNQISKEDSKIGRKEQNNYKRSGKQ